MLQNVRAQRQPLGAPQRAVVEGVVLCLKPAVKWHAKPDLPPASASSDMIRWSRVLVSHTLHAARSY